VNTAKPTVISGTPSEVENNPVQPGDYASLPPTTEVLAPTNTSPVGTQSVQTASFQSDFGGTSNEAPQIDPQPAQPPVEIVAADTPASMPTDNVALWGDEEEVQVEVDESLLKSDDE